MTVDRWFFLGMAVFAIGGAIMVAALAVQNSRTNRHHDNALAYSRAVDEAVRKSDEAVARGDFDEAHRVIEAAQRLKPQSE